MFVNQASGLIVVDHFELSLDSIELIPEFIDLSVGFFISFTSFFVESFYQLRPLFVMASNDLLSFFVAIIYYLNLLCVILLLKLSFLSDELIHVLLLFLVELICYFFQLWVMLLK